MAISEIQTTSDNGGPDKTPHQDWAAPPTAGNDLLCLVGYSESSGDATCTLSGWTLVADVNLTGKVRMALFYKTATGSESSRVTARLTASRYWWIGLAEVHSTTTGGWQLDMLSLPASGTSTTPAAGPTLTTTAAVEYWLAGFSVQNKTTFSAPTNSFSIIEQQLADSNGGDRVSGVMLSRITAGTGTASTGGTYSVSRSWVGVVATFQPIAVTVGMGALLTGAGSLSAQMYYFEATLLVQAAFGYGPGAADPVWADISSYARSCSWQRGRQNELNQTQAGTATVVLNDEDSHWDPNNTASPLYPYVKPGLPVRAILFVGAAAYPLFYGFAERLPRTSRVTTVYTQRQLDLVDGFALLASAGLGGFSYPVEDSDERVNDVLDDIAWPAAKRRIGVGASSIQDKAFDDDDDTRAQAHLQAVNDSENGFFFCDGDGNLVFIGRHELISDAAYTTSQAVFSDANS